MWVNGTHVGQWDMGQCDPCRSWAMGINEAHVGHAVMWVNGLHAGQGVMWVNDSMGPMSVMRLCGSMRSIWVMGLCGSMTQWDPCGSIGFVTFLQKVDLAPYPELQ